MTMAEKRVAESDTSTAAADTVESPAPIEIVTRERDDFYDRLLRKTAEFDNYRKRVERERRDQADQALLGLLQELLLVIDDFDLALEADEGEGDSAYRKGVELIHKQMTDLLRKRAGPRNLARMAAIAATERSSRSSRGREYRSMQSRHMQAYASVRIHRRLE